MTERASDAILIERFSRGGDEAAFVALVKRHGPSVERICRRFLHNEQDVEDVFQATFLTLARKAAAISWQESISAWLDAVASRLAMHARSGAARQRVRETPITVLTASETDYNGRFPENYHPLVGPSREVDRGDLRRILDDELRNLPEKYRAPVILCWLEGLTHEEAAQELGWPTGSMSRRLNRARNLLRLRLSHRGVTSALVLVFVAMVAAIAGLSGANDQKNRPSIIQSMSPYRSRSEGGQGLGQTLSILVRNQNATLDLADIIRLARVSRHVACELKGQNTGPLRGVWRDLTMEMERSAVELENACLGEDSLAVVVSAQRLDASCLNCHELFR